MQSENANEFSSLEGSILLADPSLIDPNFARSVVYLSVHDQKIGAEGFIMNHPLDKKLGDLLNAPEFEKLFTVQVYFGGPVGTEHLILVSLARMGSTDVLDFQPRISVSQATARHEEGFEIRAFVGHSGWGGGQLEIELKGSSWISQRANSNLIDVTADQMWSSTLEEMSPWHYVLSKTPENPSLN